VITPRRFSNLEYCLLNVSSLVIECLLTRGNTRLDDLFRFCKISNDELNEQDIALSVSFLFLLNKAQYLAEKDMVTLVEDVNA
jgi:hypothetical protein